MLIWLISVKWKCIKENHYKGLAFCLFAILFAKSFRFGSFGTRLGDIFRLLTIGAVDWTWVLHQRQSFGLDAIFAGSPLWLFISALCNTLINCQSYNYYWNDLRFLQCFVICFSGLHPAVDTSILSLSIRSLLPLVQSLHTPLVYLHSAIDSVLVTLAHSIVNIDRTFLAGSFNELFFGTIGGGNSSHSSQCQSTLLHSFRIE